MTHEVRCYSIHFAIKEVEAQTGKAHLSQGIYIGWRFYGQYGAGPEFVIQWVWLQSSALLCTIKKLGYKVRGPTHNPHTRQHLQPYLSLCRAENNCNHTLRSSAVNARKGHHMRGQDPTSSTASWPHSPPPLQMSPQLRCPWIWGNGSLSRPLTHPTCPPQAVRRRRKKSGGWGSG